MQDMGNFHNFQILLKVMILFYYFNSKPFKMELIMFVNEMLDIQKL